MDRRQKPVPLRAFAKRSDPVTPVFLVLGEKENGRNALALRTRPVGLTLSRWWFTVLASPIGARDFGMRNSTGLLICWKAHETR